MQLRLKLFAPNSTWQTTQDHRPGYDHFVDGDVDERQPGDHLKRRRCQPNTGFGLTSKVGTKAPSRGLCAGRALSWACRTPGSDGIIPALTGNHVAVVVPIAVLVDGETQVQSALERNHAIICDGVGARLARTVSPGAAVGIEGDRMVTRSQRFARICRQDFCSGKLHTLTGCRSGLSASRGSAARCRIASRQSQCCSNDCEWKK
jgi:hypothetical protein